MAGKFSVKETKEAISLFGGMGKGLDGAYADKKFGLEDFAHLIPLAPLVQPAVDGADLIFSELGELDEADRNELHLHIDETFGAGAFEEIGQEVLLGAAHFMGAYAKVKVFLAKDVVPKA